MKLLVTGASGFLGRYVVAAAVRRGHRVRAVVRPAGSVPATWQGDARVETVRGDLRSSEGLDEMVAGVDSVLHLAAAKAGDLYEQFGGTVLATENLLAAMVDAGVDRLILISSFSVYEYLDRRDGDLLDESSPLATDPFVRDEYCQTKLMQERIVRECAQAHDWRCVVLRPGVIYGRDNLWTARIGVQAGARWWIATGRGAPLPLSYVENCAEAVVMAAEYEGPERRLVLNVVDDETPTQKAYVAGLKAHMRPAPWVVPVPWPVMRALAGLAWLTNRWLFNGMAKVPGLFVPARLHARCKPLRYDNRKIVVTLGWRPRFSWQEGIARALGDMPLTDLPVAVAGGDHTGTSLGSS